MTTAGTAAKKTFALTLFLFLISLFCLPSSAHASCVNPTGNPGDFRYYGGFQTPEYCDGASWVAMGPVGDARTGLVGWWKLDDGSGTSAIDSSGHSNTGTLGNSPTWTTSGMNNGALTFVAASSQYVDIPYAANQFNLSGAATISAWIQLTSLPASATIADNIWGTQHNGFQLQIQSGTAVLCIPADSTGQDFNALSYTFSTGVWYHVACSIGGGQYTIYVNGVSIGTQSLGHPPQNPTVDTCIGSGSDGGCYPGYFPGTLDDVRIYNRALTAQDIHTLYTSTGPLSGDIQTGLVGYWKFDEGSGTVANDSTGNGSTGTLVNAPTWVAGKINGALTFNGTSQYVNVGTLSQLAGASQVAVSFWAKTTNTSSLLAIAASYNGNVSTQPSLEINYNRGTTYPQSQYLWFGIRDGNGAKIEFHTTNTTNAMDGNWHQVAVNYNLGAATGQVYIDGVLQAISYNQIAAGSVMSQLAVPWYIGGMNDGGTADTFFPGTIDDVRVYNRALTQSDVLTLYNTYATACANSVGYAGDLIYNGAPYHVPQFCNGTNWIAVGPVPGAGGGGCSGPTGGEGDMRYNGDKGFEQYCDGTHWIGIGQGYYGPQTGLVGWWKLDETSGTSASDSSGNGNTGTANNTTIVAGQINNARQFNGTTDYVHVNDSSSLHLGSLTLSAWVYATAIQGANAGGEEELLDKRSGSCGAYDLRMAGTSFPLLLNLTLDGGTGTELSTNGGSVPQNTWTHVTATFDNSSKQVNLYVNGVLQHTTTMAIDPSVNPCTTVLSLGDAGAIVGDPSIYETVGKLDDVRVYNRALSTSEVWQLYLVTGGQ